MWSIHVSIAQLMGWMRISLSVHQRWVEFSTTHIDVCICNTQKWSPKNERHFHVDLHIEHYELGRDEAILDSHKNVLHYFHQVVCHLAEAVSTWVYKTRLYNWIYQILSWAWQWRFLQGHIIHGRSFASWLRMLLWNTKKIFGWLERGE